MDYIKEDTTKKGASSELTSDRGQWRRKTHFDPK